MSNTSDPWNEALRAIFTKSATDADFRAKCLSDPSVAIKEVTGLDVVGVTFAETNDGTGIPLPAFGSDPDELIDMEHLDSVAGGDPGQFHPQSTSASSCGYQGP